MRRSLCKARAPRHGCFFLSAREAKRSVKLYESKESRRRWRGDSGTLAADVYAGWWVMPEGRGKQYLEDVSFKRRIEEISYCFVCLFHFIPFRVGLSLEGSQDSLMIFV